MNINIVKFSPFFTMILHTLHYYIHHDASRDTCNIVDETGDVDCVYFYLSFTPGAVGVPCSHHQNKPTFATGLSVLYQVALSPLNNLSIGFNEITAVMHHLANLNSLRSFESARERLVSGSARGTVNGRMTCIASYLIMRGDIGRTPGTLHKASSIHPQPPTEAVLGICNY